VAIETHDCSAGETKASIQTGQTGRLTDGQDTVEEVEAELRDSHWEIIDAEVSFKE